MKGRIWNLRKKSTKGRPLLARRTEPCRYAAINTTVFVDEYPIFNYTIAPLTYFLNQEIKQTI